MLRHVLAGLRKSKILTPYSYASNDNKNQKFKDSPAYPEKYLKVCFILATKKVRCVGNPHVKTLVSYSMYSMLPGIW